MRWDAKGERLLPADYHRPLPHPEPFGDHGVASAEVDSPGQLPYLILLGFEGLLLGGQHLAFTLYAGLFVVFTLADF